MQLSKSVCILFSLLFVLKINIYAKCPNSWHKLEDTCIYIVNDPKPWEEAEKYCSNNSSFLLTLCSEQMEKKLPEILTKIQTSSFQPLKTGIWLNSTSQRCKKDKCNSTYSNYSNWERDIIAPTNVCSIVFIREFAKIAWRRENCNLSKFFICQKRNVDISSHYDMCRDISKLHSVPKTSSFPIVSTTEKRQTDNNDDDSLINVIPATVIGVLIVVIISTAIVICYKHKRENTKEKQVDRNQKEKDEVAKTQVDISKYVSNEGLVYVTVAHANEHVKKLETEKSQNIRKNDEQFPMDTDKDAGRYKTEEGLVYVTVEHAKKVVTSSSTAAVVDSTLPSASKLKEDIVEYASVCPLKQ